MPLTLSQPNNVKIKSILQQYQHIYDGYLKRIEPLRQQKRLSFLESIDQNIRKITFQYLTKSNHIAIDQLTNITILCLTMTQYDSRTSFVSLTKRTYMIRTNDVTKFRTDLKPLIDANLIAVFVSPQKGNLTTHTTFQIESDFQQIAPILIDGILESPARFNEMMYVFTHRDDLSNNNWVANSPLLNQWLTDRHFDSAAVTINRLLNNWINWLVRTQLP